MKATAVASPNFALVKYWGKRDERLVLPHNSSISITCDGLWCRTSVEFDRSAAHDSITVNGETLREDEKNIIGALDRVRKLGGVDARATVVSETNFPVAAGLASSAAGLSAFTVAALRAARVELVERELSIFTRELSGSACRSLFDGFVEWHRGRKEDGSDSYAESIAPAAAWSDLRVVVVMVTAAKKKIGSRNGMATSVATSPYYRAWLETVEKDLANVREGIARRDLEQMGETAERNALKMHAVMQTTQPPLLYWLPQTLEVMEAVWELRRSGIGCYFTIDAGPQVKVLCERGLEAMLLDRFNSMDSVLKCVVCRPGAGAHVEEAEPS